MTLPVRPSPSPPSIGERWHPFRDLEELHSRTGQLMESVLTGAGAAEGVWTPLVDIEETDDAWIVEAEVPGVDRNDIDIEVQDNELRISGEIKEKERVGLLRRRTRRRGEFDYRVMLPGDADPEGIEAKLKDGVLTLRIPKPQKSEPRRIEVQAG